MTAYAVLARGMARELVVPHDLCAVVSWATTLVHARLGPRPAERRTAIINRVDEDGRHDSCFADAHAYLATKIDPRALGRFRLSGVGGGGERGRWNSLSMVPATRCPTSSRAWSSGGLPSPRKAVGGCANRGRWSSASTRSTRTWRWAGAAAGARAQDLHERELVVARHRPPPPRHVRHGRHGPGAEAIHRRRPRPGAGRGSEGTSSTARPGQASPASSPPLPTTSASTSTTSTSSRLSSRA
ncbi:hypothetical protein DAI22_01g221300 [Oryza sativa Japonica Group]|nr:hypothetical protein DAI22_01g221300 [Oryza sativa Japonica Group]